MIHKGVKLLHVNTRSIFKKLDLLNVLYPDVDFLCCSETWLDDRVLDNLVNVNCMKVFRSDRKKGIQDYNTYIIGGGVLCFRGEEMD